LKRRKYVFLHQREDTCIKVLIFININYSTEVTIEVLTFESYQCYTV